MATAAESTFINAVIAAESTRQAAKASAFTTYAYTVANLAAYRTALVAVDVAYVTAVNTAANTAGITLNSGKLRLTPGAFFGWDPLERSRNSTNSRMLPSVIGGPAQLPFPTRDIARCSTSSTACRA